MVMLSPNQKATLSPEAIQTLTDIPTIPFASLVSPYLASTKRIKNLRETTAAKLTPIEEDIIARHKLTVHTTTIANVSVVTITPPEPNPSYANKILLNFYGGGFVMGGARERAALLTAAEMRIRVYSVEYSKSPEVRYPVARDEGLAVYRQLVADMGAENISVMGSSSGGQLVMSMLLMARKEKIPLPTRVFLCTPSVDLSGAGDSMVSNEGRDVMPVSLLTAIVRQNYQPADVDVVDPFYSPVYAEYDAGFPPTVITVGTRDLCLSSGVRMYWKLRGAGVKAELLVGEGMWHGYNWAEAVPEAVVVRKAVREFLEEGFKG